MYVNAWAALLAVFYGPVGYADVGNKIQTFVTVMPTMADHLHSAARALCMLLFVQFYALQAKQVEVDEQRKLGLVDDCIFVQCDSEAVAYFIWEYSGKALEGRGQAEFSKPLKVLFTSSIGTSSKVHDATFSGPTSGPSGLCWVSFTLISHSSHSIGCTGGSCGDQAWCNEQGAKS